MNKELIENYNKLIENISLRSIVQIEGSYIVDKSLLLVDKLVPTISDDVKCDINDDGLFFSQKYKLYFHKYKQRKRLIKIGALFIATYVCSKISVIDDDSIELFKKHNLPLNTWPFFREFVKTSLARADMPPLYLPVIKSND